MNHTVRLYCLITSFLSIACNQSNTVKTVVQTPKEYYRQEVQKGNVNDSLFLGFTFAMDSVAAMKHIEEVDCWNFYSTQSGRDRLYIKKKRLENSLGHKLYGYEFDYNCDFRGYENDYDIMIDYTSPYSPIDDYPYNSAFTTKMVLINEDGSFREEYVSFGLSYYRGMLSEVLVTLSGESNRDKSMIQPESFFNSIVKTYNSKYGEPYILEDKKAVWVNGIIHIVVDYYGVQYYHHDEFIGNPRHFSYYFPLFTIRYSNYALSLQEVADLGQERQEKARKDEEAKAKKQAELKQRFNTSNSI